MRRLHRRLQPRRLVLDQGELATEGSLCSLQPTYCLAIFFAAGIDFRRKRRAGGDQFGQFGLLAGCEQQAGRLDALWLIEAAQLGCDVGIGSFQFALTRWQVEFGGVVTGPQCFQLFPFAGKRLGGGVDYDAIARLRPLEQGRLRNVKAGAQRRFSTFEIGQFREPGQRSIRQTGKLSQLDLRPA